MARPDDADQGGCREKKPMLESCLILEDHSIRLLRVRPSRHPAPFERALARPMLPAGWFDRWSGSRPVAFDRGGLARARLVLGLALAMVWCGLSARGAEDARERFQSSVQPILIDYCYQCHAEGASKGGVAFDGSRGQSAILADQAMWFKVLRNVRLGIMPPVGKERPTKDELARLESWIKRDVFAIDPQDPDPGRVTIRRLNRVEYRNTIRDLMNFEYRTDEEFPPDDTGYGFDTIADVLSISPLLMEKYLRAAETIVTKTVPIVSRVMPERTIPGLTFKVGEGSGNRLSFYKAGKLSRSLSIDKAGEYRLTIELGVNGAFEFDPARAKVSGKLDGQEILAETYSWHDGKTFKYAIKRSLKAGDHAMEFELLPIKSDKKRVNDVFLRVSSIRLEGPLDPKSWSRPEGYERWFFQGEPPQGAAQRRDYAREILKRFASRAFRRPVERETLERLTALAERIYRSPGKGFEQGVARAMVAVLASPRFLFRLESVANDQGNSPYALIDEYSLASRLSYFLWSTMPDQVLLDLAARGELRKNLPAQVARMLESPRFDMLVRNFVGQWLESRDAESVSINSRAVMRAESVRLRVNLDEGLRRSMRREPEMLFAHIARENLGLLEMIDADYSFLNVRLAELYGIKGVKGLEMRKVDLPKDGPRGGVLTQASFLMVTSNPTRTSPVKRGQFILENILGAPAPPPPPNIPPLEEAKGGTKDHEPTVRELMAVHRAKPLCASCHARLDPLGLALENYNALGVWRETERARPIDPSGRLITGESFANVRELKRILKEQHKIDFYRCITEKMLTYALGRGLDAKDVEAVDRVVARLDGGSGRFRELVLGVVESVPFEKRRRTEQEAVARRPAGDRATEAKEKS